MNQSKPDSRRRVGRRILLLSGLAALWLAGGLAAVVVADRRSDQQTGAAASSGSGVQIWFSASDLTGAYSGLCAAIQLSEQGDGIEARDLFYRQSHDVLHSLIEVIRSSNDAAARSLEATKNDLESTLGYMFQGTDPVPDLQRLVSAVSAAATLADIDLAPTCA